MMNGLYSHDCRRHGFSQKIIFHLEKGNFKNGIVSRQIKKLTVSLALL